MLVLVDEIILVLTTVVNADDVRVVDASVGMTLIVVVTVIVEVCQGRPVSKKRAKQAATGGKIRDIPSLL